MNLNFFPTKDEFALAKQNLARLQAQSGLKTATFAGGCFWCIEAAFAGVPGVVGSVSGYMGGNRPNPNYEQVSTGVTGHKEAVMVFYDPKKVSYPELLKIFWLQIDPTDPNGQFADQGDQYKTAIFVNDPEQEVAAQKSKQVLAKSGRYDQPIATEILPVGPFYPAEDFHQSYSQEHREAYERYAEGSGRKAFIKANMAKNPIK